MTEIRKGAKVKHTIICTSREDTTAELIMADGWGFDVIEESFEILEDAYPHGNPEDDPIGTVRRMLDADEAPAYSTVKVAEDSWVDLDEINSKDFWPDRFQVDAPIIGAVPGTPAAEGFNYYQDSTPQERLWRFSLSTGSTQFWCWRDQEWSNGLNDSLMEVERSQGMLTPVDPSELTKEQREA